MQQLYQSSAQQPSLLTVADPLSRKLQVPSTCLHETRALQRAGVPSLCMLFLQGRCRQGVNCHQVHADPHVVLQLRQAALQLPTCCQRHGDSNSAFFSSLTEAKRSSRLVIQEIIIPLTCVGYTTGLQHMLEEAKEAGDVVASTNSVCRLHFGGRCRYSEDCKFLHICRELVQNYLSAYVRPLIPDLELRHGDRGQKDLPLRECAARPISNNNNNNNSSSNNNTIVLLANNGLVMVPSGMFPMQVQSGPPSYTSTSSANSMAYWPQQTSTMSQPTAVRRPNSFEPEDNSLTSDASSLGPSSFPQYLHSRTGSEMSFQKVHRGADVDVSTETDWSQPSSAVDDDDVAMTNRLLATLRLLDVR